MVDPTDLLRNVLLLIRIEELKTKVPVGMRFDTRYEAKLTLMDIEVLVVKDEQSPFSVDWALAGDDWSVAGKQAPFSAKIVFGEPVNPDGMARDAVTIKMCCDERKAALEGMEDRLYW